MDRPYRSRFPAEPLTGADVRKPVSRPGGGLAAEPNREYRIMRRVQIEGAERPVERTGNGSGQQIVGQLVDPGDHRGAHWHWLGARESDGRAVVKIDRSKRQVSRVLWALFRRAPSVTKVVRRTCGDSSCVSPWHAEMVGRGSWQVDPERVAGEAAQIERLLSESGLDDCDRSVVLSRAGATPRLAAVKQALAAQEAEMRSAMGQVHAQRVKNFSGWRSRRSDQ